MKLFSGTRRKKRGSGEAMSSDHRQPTNDDDRTIVNSLRLIFPQFGEAVFRECIANTRRLFAEADPNAILTETINFLLAGTYHEIHVEQNEQVEQRNDAIVLKHEEDDIVYVGTTNDGPILIDDLSEPPRIAKNGPAKNAMLTTSARDLVELGPGGELLVQPTIAGACSADQLEPVQDAMPTTNTSPLVEIVPRGECLVQPTIAGACSADQLEPVQDAIPTTSTSALVEIVPRGECLVQPTIAGACSVDQLEPVPQPSEQANSTATTMPRNDLNKPDVNSGTIRCNELQPVDPIEKAFQELCGMFTTVDEAYLRNLLQKWPGFPYDMLVNNACHHLLENRNYPKKERVSSKQTTSKDEMVHDYFTEYSSPVSYKYELQCLQLLDDDFRMIRMKDIRTVLRKFNFHYAPCKKALEESLATALNQMQRTAYSSSVPSSYMLPTSTSVTQQPKPTHNSFPVVSVQLLKCGRTPRKLPDVLVPELQDEVDFVKRLKLERTAEQDRQVALMLNEEQYQEEGQLIECGCCYGEAAFEQMVQCMDGHLFCGDCLRSYAKEAAFGQGKAKLTCMTDGCSSTFPVSQLKQCLPANILTKYEDRVQEESLSLAQVEDLVKCPGCDYAVIMPPGDKVFKCQDPLCAKEICRYCKEDWSEHFGIPCSEIEKGNEKKLRLSYEERMTMAKIRKCARCGCEFTKSEGCNKMTCRCGATQCYVCRKPSIHYSHFCNHPRDPGQKCTKCTNCSLWSDPSEDDDRAVKELEAEAVEAKRKLDATAPENAPKKVRVDQM